MVSFMSNIYKLCTIIIFFFFKISIFYNYIVDVERTKEVENINDQNHRDGYREEGLLLNFTIFISIDMYMIINFIICLHVLYSKHYDYFSYFTT